MNVSLTPELEAFVKTQLESGLYHSQSEVIREGLRLLKRFSDYSQEYKLWLNEQIASVVWWNNSEYLSMLYSLILDF